MKQCPSCGSQVDDNETVCPNCGASLTVETSANPAQPTYQTSSQVPAGTTQENSVWAILALVFGITGGLGIVFGPIGLAQYKYSSGPNHQRNKIFCIVGFCLSIFWIILWIVLMAIEA